MLTRLSNKVKEFRISNNIPILSDTLFFQIEVFNELKNLRIYNYTNFSNDHFKALKYFQKHKPFKVANRDRNIGSALISNKLYNELVMSLLNDENTYSYINENPINNIILEINDQII